MFHSGCITAKIVENIRKKLEGIHERDFKVDDVDGFDELENQEDKDKVTKMFEQGYVDDEDWNGVRCLSYWSSPVMRTIRC